MSKKQDDRAKAQNKLKSSEKGSKKRFTLQKSDLKKSSLKVKKDVQNRYEKIKKILFPKEIFIKGQEPPKSYAFQRKFYGIYAIFFIYSFILLLAVNLPDNILINILTMNNRFAFAISLVFFFIILSILFSVDEIRVFIFENYTVIKQILFYIGIFIPLFLLFSFVNTSINFTTSFLALSMLWLVILSSRFYTYSRKFSTKIEARVIKKYSVTRNLIVAITPFIILVLLVVISIAYRSFLVYFALDFFGPLNPEGAVKVYTIEMRLIMPLIYLSLVLTLVFIIFEFIFTRRRAETRRAGSFDNFAFSLIVLFIFFYQILQVTIFLIMRPETVSTIKASVGDSSATVTFIFFLEFAISMFFLYRVITKLTRTFGWRIIFFKKDGLIIFFLALVFAQTVSRFSVATSVPNQQVAGIGTIFSADKYIISIIMIIFLGFTLLIYYLKPHETSMFMRMQKETVDEEEKSMDQIYKIIRSEYIRRGESFPLEIIEREIFKSTHLSKAMVDSFVKRLAARELDIELTPKRGKSGEITYIIDFISITERFEKKGVAAKKAQKFLLGKLIKSTSAEKHKTLRLGGNLKSDKASDQFISSLTADYTKKHEDEESIKKMQEGAIISFKDKKGGITEETIVKVLEVIKKEYIFRIENPEKNPDFHIPISEVVTQVQMATDVNPGELFPILENLSKKDFELSLIRNPKLPGDKKIKFTPIASDNMCYSLANFRPEVFAKLRVLVIKKFLTSLKTKKDQKILSKLKVRIKRTHDKQKAWFNVLSILQELYPKYEKQLNYMPDNKKLIKLLNRMIKIRKKQQLASAQKK